MINLRGLETNCTNATESIHLEGITTARNHAKWANAKILQPNAHRIDRNKYLQTGSESIWK